MKKVLAVCFILVFLSCHRSDNKNDSLTNNEGENEMIETILTRRSIRKYKPQQVERAKLDTVMKAAIYAPSALNKQPWEVRVVQNKEFIDKINDRFVAFARGREMQGSASRAAEPGFSVFHGAPTVIVLARDKNNHSSMLDVGLLTQNILLSAHALGLGTCPIGSVVSILTDPANKELVDLLKIPEDYEIVLAVSLGYSDESPVVKERYADKVIYME
ncbi:MAG TPA: nitroreductase [Porphyromonadaceae bacterium]|jgi:nitroreductase|nr:nitroreductase [Porphyromonadaceae bacterium]HBL32291.1 nitroreductase [Porphyromonadaceae bacterium]HBX20169.1 nitroreductase [Porphyromonadaceae bacterium]HCM22133.1 nitroreductase [Porphyromonadaceae bacterium]